MGKGTEHRINFYLKNLQLDKFGKHCEFLHNNELPVRDVYCPDCKTQVFHNNTLNICLCYTCFRIFEREEIIKLDPNSKNCRYCKKKIIWYSEYCGDCTDRTYKLGGYLKEKIRLISSKMDGIKEFIFNYKWSYYEYEHKKRQLKEINKTINSLKSLKKCIKNVDVYLGKMNPIKEKKGSMRWERRCNNNIKSGIKILKKEKELKQKMKNDKIEKREDWCYIHNEEKDCYNEDGDHDDYHCQKCEVRMTNCVICGEVFELDQRHFWDVFYLCKKCENKLEDSTECSNCKKKFSQLMKSENRNTLAFKEHMIKCNKVFWRFRNNTKNKVD